MLGSVRSVLSFSFCYNVTQNGLIVKYKVSKKKKKKKKKKKR